MATDSYSHLLSSMNFDGDAQVSNASTILDQLDSDFLNMTENEISESTNASFDLEQMCEPICSSFDVSLDDPCRHSLSMSSIISDYDYDSPQSPAHQKQEAPFDVSHPITPDQKNLGIQLPDLTELQMQYQTTLKKLANSMRQSDATRSVLKRQREFSPSLSFESDGETDYFSSPRCRQLEQSRKRLLCVVDRDA
jgi:hypothetical protein